MSRKLATAAAFLVLSAGLAHAQAGGSYGGVMDSGMSLGSNTSSGRSPEELERDKEIERKYQETIRKIPDKKVANDPWKTMRAAPAAK
jgi:hypothetical protein